jgi:hypothetical protein
VLGVEHPVFCSLRCLNFECRRLASVLCPMQGFAPAPIALHMHDV